MKFREKLKDRIYFIDRVVSRLWVLNRVLDFQQPFRDPAPNSALDTQSINGDESLSRVSSNLSLLSVYDVYECFKAENQQLFALENIALGNILALPSPNQNMQQISQQVQPRAHLTFQESDSTIFDLALMSVSASVASRPFVPRQFRLRPTIQTQDSATHQLIKDPHVCSLAPTVSMDRSSIREAVIGTDRTDSGILAVTGNPSLVVEIPVLSFGLKSSF